MRRDKGYTDVSWYITGVMFGFVLSAAYSRVSASGCHLELHSRASIPFGPEVRKGMRDLLVNLRQHTQQGLILSESQSHSAGSTEHGSSASEGTPRMNTVTPLSMTPCWRSIRVGLPCPDRLVIATAVSLMIASQTPQTVHGCG